VGGATVSRLLGATFGWLLTAVVASDAAGLVPDDGVAPAAGSAESVGVDPTDVVPEATESVLTAAFDEGGSLAGALGAGSGAGAGAGAGSCGAVGAAGALAVESLAGAETVGGGSEAGGVT
jgi:hypothetical protein